VESTRLATETRTNTFLKEAVNERYDRYLLDAFRAGGNGWQTRMNMLCANGQLSTDCSTEKVHNLLYVKLSNN
jgi:hypothetical protein